MGEKQRTMGEKYPSNQDSPWKGPDGIPGMPSRICLKDYFSIEVIVNFSLYSADRPLTTASYFF